MCISFFDLVHKCYTWGTMVDTWISSYIHSLVYFVLVVTRACKARHDTEATIAPMTTPKTLKLNDILPNTRTNHH
jgi:hypothetical protein